ncbi:uncharacterized protein [Physcomitrium patens]|uniref:Knr4/Smi1-like domain-containing protein n=1 Tax=Physcomitrium patens TaxID=3218 RepID=A0A2K1IJC1_PHYPA|nr:uncharacterized protein LOC112275520 [Physcomitrium patens]PNR29373.1 hypothetical protein PHYPA_028066 [Physcomitrium patens]|eukprot:XP_024361707.1 uncharacterized protein LOC112275520 [Physcomitrella patens]
MLDTTEQVPLDPLRSGTPAKHHQAQLAGLKRLSARASAGPITPPGTRRVFFSFSAYARSVLDKLKKCKVPIAEGLSDEEFERIEATYGITFPPDLKGILHEGLPVGAGFPNWRAGNRDHLSMRINLPVVGLLREVANSSFWWKAWGPRPKDINQAVRIARSAIRKSPILVPMYGHCYIPSSPNLAGNPVFFVYQKNAVYCGYDVADFFNREAFLSHKFEFGDLMYDMGSFRNEKSIEGGALEHANRDVDFEPVHRSSHSSSGTDVSEASGSGSSSSEGESWGRSLDVLAKKTEFLVSPLKRNLQNEGGGRQLSFSRGFDRQPQDTHTPQGFGSYDDILRYSHIVEKALPLKVLENVCMAPEDARTPRRIEFWSDLADKVHKQIFSRVEGFSSPRRQDFNLLKPRTDSTNENLEEQDGIKPSKWLNVYLDEISLVLRQGGWREDDINDMIVSESPSKRWNQQHDSEAVLVSLAREVELLSTSLKRAGWSVPDVTETMKMGLGTRT